MSTEEETMTVDLTIYMGESDRVQLREIAYGVTPIVTMEPVIDGEDVSFRIISSLIEQEELAELFEVLAIGLKEGEIK